MGGYVAACALRAAGASTPELRPAAFSCHYLSVAQFGTVDIRVSTRKRGRTACAQRVEITQGDRPILDAMAWSVGDVEGLEHDETIPPDVPGPEQAPGDRANCCPTTRSRRSRSGTTSTRSRSSSRRNGRPTDRGPRRWQAWLRFLPTATFDDPWIDATPQRDPRRPAELAVGAPSARVEAARVHGADTRPQRRVPHAGERDTSGCCATAPRRCRPADCSAGPHGSGRPAAGSTRRAAASASTGRMP